MNCEQIPLLPASIVARMLADPRKIPYLLVWKREQDGAVKEAVRIAPHDETEGCMVGKRADRTQTVCEAATGSAALPPGCTTNQKAARLCCAPGIHD